MSMTQFKDGNGDFFNDAVKSKATAFTNNAGHVIVAYKDCIVPFIITPTRHNSATNNVCKLLIIGANFDQSPFQTATHSTHSPHSWPCKMT